MTMHLTQGIRCSPTEQLPAGIDGGNKLRGNVQYFCDCDWR